MNYLLEQGSLSPTTCHTQLLISHLFFFHSLLICKDTRRFLVFFPPTWQEQQHILCVLREGFVRSDAL